MMEFELLRFSLGIDSLDDLTQSGFFQKVDWDKMYDFAEKQTLSGIFADGISKLPAGPDEEQVMRWMGQQMTIRHRNIQLNKACGRLYNKVKELGFGSCILKGQGNALLYPNGYMRTPGDIDLWVNGTRKEIKALAEQLAGDNGVIGELSYNHIEMEIDGIAVELHFTPAFMNGYLHNRTLQKWMKSEAEQQFSHHVTLPDTDSEVCIPTTAFNLVYQLVHLFHHIFFEGIGLRQIVDYYFVLMNASNEDLVKAREVINHLDLIHFAGAVMYVLQEVLHLGAEKMIVAADEKRGHLLLTDILQGGNFGHYANGPSIGHAGLQHNLLRLKRDWKLIKYYPTEALSEPSFRVWHYFWRMVNK